MPWIQSRSRWAVQRSIKHFGQYFIRASLQGFVYSHFFICMGGLDWCPANGRWTARDKIIIWSGLYYFVRGWIESTREFVVISPSHSKALIPALHLTYCPDSWFRSVVCFRRISVISLSPGSFCLFAITAPWTSLRTHWELVSDINRPGYIIAPIEYIMGACGVLLIPDGIDCSLLLAAASSHSCHLLHPHFTYLSISTVENNHLQRLSTWRIENTHQ